MKLVTFVDSLASKCHAFWMTFLQFCHTSLHFSWILMNWTEPSPRKHEQFYFAPNASLALVEGTVPYKPFQGYPFRIRAITASGKGKLWWSKMMDKLLQIQRPKISLDLLQSTAAGLCHQTHGKNDQGASATQEHQRAACNSQALRQPLRQTTFLPAPHHLWLNSNTHQAALHLSYHPWRHLFQYHSLF